MATHKSAVGNGTTDSAGKYNSVVTVDVDGQGECSGTLVTPFYVLTANHCVTGEARKALECVIAKGVGIGDLSATVDINFYFENDPSGTFYTSSPFYSPARVHTAAKSGDLIVRTVDAIDPCSDSDIAKDLALIRLDQRVSTDDFKPIHPPIVGLTSLTSSPDCLAGKDQDHLTGTVVGYGDTQWDISIVPPKLFDTYGNPDRERHYATSTGWSRHTGLYFKAFSIFDTYHGGLPGDSGGPWFTGGCLAGVNSAVGAELNPGPAVSSKHTDLETPGNQTFLQDHILDESKTHFVGQCNPGDPNPWNDPKLENTDNGDHDGMPDACDPCPFDPDPDPQGDFSRPAKCSSGDQDCDGVPDVCDNCPPSLCEQRGEPASDCYNPYPAKFGPQADFDGDGIGDVCDTCPTTPNHDANYGGPGVDDPDNDGVGAACDDCDKRNPVKPCTSDADCQYFPGDKNGFCIQIGKYGKCNDADGWACALNKGNAGCRDGVTCQYLGDNYGRCSQQLDDVNHNGVGGECDSCDSVKGNTILANSNDIRESLELADPLGDVCDPVPLYSTRMVITPTEVSGVGGTMHPFDAYDPNKRTRFTATAGIGYDETKGGAAPPALTLTTGFRWTNCHDFNDHTGATNWELDTCIKKYATKNPTTGYNPPPGVDSTFVHITTKTYPYALNQAFGHDVFPGTGSDQTIQRTFTTSVSGDYEVHPYGSQEVQRVGAIENLLWDHAADIAFGNVTPYYLPNNTTAFTVGALWSHVEDNGTGYASGRDKDFYDGAKGLTNGGLRDNYAYVGTPAVELVIPYKISCANAPCYPQWSADLLVDPAQTIISPASLVATSPEEGLLTCSGGCSVVGPTGAADVTGAIASPLAQDIQDPTLEFVPAVERGYQVRHTGTATPGVMSVMMPRDWANGSIPTSVVFDGRSLGLQSFIGRSPVRAARASLQIAPVGPPSRSGPAYALTVKQSALYMVGGTLSSGEPAREIWRYDLLGHTWDQLVSAASGALDDPAPFDVLAASYDPSQSQLAYVDQATSVDDHGHATRVGRLVVVGTAPLSTRVALVLPRTGRLGRVFLTARGNGTWVLTAGLGRGSAHAWIAYDFALDQDGNLTWNGWQIGQGAIVQQPLNSSNGVFLPVNHDGGTRFVRLEPTDFKHSGGKWDTL